MKELQPIRSRQSEWITLCTMLTCLIFVGCGIKVSSGSSNGTQQSISGIAARGKALSKKQVKLLDSDLNEKRATTTDSTGRFEFTKGKSEDISFIQVEDLLSALPTDNQKQKEVVHVNPITTAATNEILKLPKTDRNFNAFKNKGQEVLSAVLGSNVAFEKFSSDPDFRAAVPEDQSIKPAAADIVLDVLSQRAKSASKDIAQLIQEKQNSDQSCKSKSIFSDEGTALSLGGFIAEHGISKAELSQELGLNLSALNLLSNQMVNSFKNFENKLTGLNAKSQLAAKAAFRNAIVKTLKRQKSNQGICDTAELSSTEIERVQNNFSAIMEDKIIEIAQRSQQQLQEETKATFLIEATTLQASSVIQQMVLTTVLDSNQVNEIQSLASKVATFTETNLIIELTASTEVQISSSKKMEIANRTRKAREEVTNNNLLKGSAKKKIPTTSDLIEITEDLVDQLETISRPSFPPQSVTIDISAFARRALTANLFITNAVNQNGITDYSIYWGAGPATKTLTNSFISRVPKTSAGIQYQITPDETLPSDASYVLVFSNNRGRDGVFAAFTPLRKPVASLKHYKVPVASSVSNPTVYKMKVPSARVQSP